MLQLAAKHSLPVQIHTGIQEGNGNILFNSNPLHLNNLFLEYNNVVFDIFHADYPWYREIGVLAKMFPNVYVDMCWFHVISPQDAREALSVWLDTVPVNKILGFGGDYVFVEGAYGHAQIARSNIAKVLAEKVEEGVYDIGEAIVAARRLLRENALDVFFKNRRLH